jgi:hypothetical protein
MPTEQNIMENIEPEINKIWALFNFKIATF